MYCNEVKELMSDLVATTDKLSLVLIDPLKQPETAQEYGLKKDSLGFMYPAITFSVLEDDGQEKHYNIWFYGIQPDMSLQHFWTTSYCFQQVM